MSSSTIFIQFSIKAGFEEIVLPSVESSDIYTKKAGQEILKQMYTFQDKAERDLCLRPEGTATCQLLANGPLARQRDVKLFYETRCWRYEKPQAGRYREFWQFGVEVLNPSQDYAGELMIMGCEMIAGIIGEDKMQLKTGVKRGLDYYTEDGWEVIVPSLGAQKQVLGAGCYAEGIGFAIGLDRLLLAAKGL